MSLKVFWEEISGLIQLTEERSFLTNVNKYQPISGGNKCNRKAEAGQIPSLSSWPGMLILGALGEQSS